MSSARRTRNAAHSTITARATMQIVQRMSDLSSSELRVLNFPPARVARSGPALRLALLAQDRPREKVAREAGDEVVDGREFVGTREEDDPEEAVLGLRAEARAVDAEHAGREKQREEVVRGGQ